MIIILVVVLVLLVIVIVIVILVLVVVVPPAAVVVVVVVVVIVSNGHCSTATPGRNPPPSGELFPWGLFPTPGREHCSKRFCENICQHIRPMLCNATIMIVLMQRTTPRM